MSSAPNAMPSPATVEIWTIDKCILAPGIAARELNRLIARETELLDANNRYLERARQTEQSFDRLQKHERQWRSVATRALVVNDRISAEQANLQIRLSEAEFLASMRFTQLEMESALCVWEWMLDAGAVPVQRWREAIGTVMARQAAFEIGRYCIEIYELGRTIAGPEAWDGVSYDWDIVPAICATIHYSEQGFHYFHDDSAEIAKHVLDKVNSPPTPASPVSAPVVVVNMSGFERAAAAIKQFGIDLKAFLEPLDKAPLSFRYRNYRGEVSVRTVRPLNIYFGSTEWHPEPQWLLAATDIEKGERRDFAIKDINPPAFTAFELDRLIAAVEGECDGLAIDHKQAEAILKYVIFEHP